MADIRIPRCAAASPDPIQLQAQVMNSLSRCMRELRAEVPDYESAELHLADAADALRALSAVQSGAVH